MRNQIVGFTIGILLIIVSIAELAPAMLDLQDGEREYSAFLWCSMVSFFFGALLVFANRHYKRSLNVRQIFLLTTASWFFLSLFSCFPFYYSELDLTFTDAFFESASGITTTGSTVLSGLDEMPHGILLWRSIIQWIGGIGIIAFAIVILPFLNIGGMQLFQAESSDRSEKLMPRTSMMVFSLILVYVGLTLACAITYSLLGMEMFDAVNHALTTIPTGGYSTHDASFGYFQEPSLHYAASFFMLCGGIPFVLYVKYLYHGKFDFLKDEQCRALLIIVASLTMILSFWLWTNSDYSLATSLKFSLFNIISVITTTGYATTDYTLWGSFAVTFFFFITFLGASAGSTAGGFKTMRIVIVCKIVSLQLKRLIYPHGVFVIRYQGRQISKDMIDAVYTFVWVFILTNTVLTLLLTALGLDFLTAISGAATALANVGPGIGDVIGPAGNFSSLPDAAKWLLSIGMILGRLEIMTVLVLFRKEFWVQ